MDGAEDVLCEHTHYYSLGSRGRLNERSAIASLCVALFTSEMMRTDFNRWTIYFLERCLRYTMLRVSSLQLTRLYVLVCVVVIVYPSSFMILPVIFATRYGLISSTCDLL